MAWVTTEQALDQVRKMLEERFDKRRSELTSGPDQVAPVLKWLLGEFAFPNEADRGDFPKGVVSFDERASERREQDTGETATIDFTIRVYFRAEDVSDDAEITALRYGDAVLYTLMREARGKDPEDATALPGWFRVWPRTMQVGVVKEFGLRGAEVRAQIIIDQNQAFSV